MVDLAMHHEEREHSDGKAFVQIGRWLMTALMIFLGLSGPALGYIKAIEPQAD